ncbi:MAG: SRPBCC domain-containing protein [Terrimesophilobacter sp.]
MSETFVATSETLIDAPVERVWSVITDAEATKEFMFGTDVDTDWVVGNPIVWRGTWEGKDYEDRGEILEFDPDHRLVTTHFSPLTSQPDVPENYHTLTWTVKKHNEGSHLTLTQDNNASAEEAEHSESMWNNVVADVKKIAERD